MAQIASYTYTKLATYDFNLDGPITAFPGGVNMGIVLNPGEFIMSSWYKVTTPFVSAVPAVDAFAFIFNTDLFTPLYDIILGTTTALNATAGVWANGRQITTTGQVVRQTLTPQGTPSNNFLQAYRSGNANTAGAMAIMLLIGSTDI